MSDLRTRALWCVIGLALLAYGAALTGDFVFDDIHSVSANPALHDLSQFGRYWTDADAFSGTDARMYRPALLTSFALNIAISPSAWSLKLGNVLLHAAVAGLLFTWLWRLSRRTRAAFVVASLFAVHPLLSEAVNLVSARSELLGTFGIVLAMLAHVRWQRREGSVGPMVAMLFGTVLACGSKETGVVLPGLLLVQTFCLRYRVANGSEWRRAMLAVAPIVALVVVYLIARKLCLGEATVKLIGRKGADPTHGAGRTLLTQLATMGTLLPRVLWQSIVPTELSFDPVVKYRHTFFDPWVLLGWASMAGLTIGALWRGPGQRLRRIGTLLAWAIALPWIVIPLNMPLAEHRFYGPMIGLAVAMLPLATRAMRAMRRRSWSSNAVRTAFAVVVLLSAYGSARRSLLYKDERHLWNAELASNSQSFRAWWGLGTARRRVGDLVGSIEPLAQAHSLLPTHLDAHRNYVESLVMLDDADAQPYRLLVVARRLLERRTDDPWIRTLVAQANLQAGRVIGEPRYFEEAERVALSCLDIATPKGYVYQLAAFARHGLGDAEGALAHLQASRDRGLDTIGVRLDRVRLLREMERHADSSRELAGLRRDFPTDGRVLHLVREFASPPR